jgi:primary-amine oxidase
MTRLAVVLSSLLLPGLLWAADPPAPAHPLDPLTEAEIEAAVELLRADGKLTEHCWLPQISRHEPPKDEVLAFRSGAPLRRQAFILVHRRPDNRVFEAVLDLTARRVASWVEKPGVQAPLYNKDNRLVNRIVKSHPKWLERLRLRGLDPDEVHVGCWSPGPGGLPGPAGARLAVVEGAWVRDATESYARPIEGLTAIVNLTTEEVLEVRDSGPVAMPTGRGFRRGKTGHPPRPAPKPLAIALPKGPSFEVKGHEVTWQNWRFRFAPDPREGLVLYTVSYQDGGKWRPVLYRGSVTELFVNYGDPDPNHRYRMFFDIGEWGLGLNSLESGTDAPAYATFFDFQSADSRGKPDKTERAIALFERDGGLLWKHSFDDGNESRRGRQLVLLAIATIGNYDYGFQWVFHQDGTLEAEVLLTGIVQVKASAAPQSPGHNGDRFGHPVDADRRLLAMHHQHFFSYRLDLDVDGPFNRVFERNVEVLPIGPDNPTGNAFAMRETLLGRELEAKRRLHAESGRDWLVANPARKNAAREPVGYLLLPQTNAVPYADPKSLLRRRAGFIDAHVWVTPFDPAERYAAGDYAFHSKGGDGLPRWTARDRDLTEADVVLWYTLGVTHLARREEWPVMPVSRAGFKLVPCGFFDHNPALDVPKPDDGK